MRNLIIPFVMFALAMTILWRVEPVLVVGIFLGLIFALILLVLFRTFPDLDPSRLRRE